VRSPFTLIGGYSCPPNQRWLPSVEVGPKATVDGGLGAPVQRARVGRKRDFRMVTRTESPGGHC